MSKNCILIIALCFFYKAYSYDSGAANILEGFELKQTIPDRKTYESKSGVVLYEYNFNGEKDTPKPFLTYFHGGPGLSLYGYEDLLNLCREEGYTFFAVEISGSNANQQLSSRSSSNDDIKELVRYFNAREDLDKQKAWGVAHSYGGYQLAYYLKTNKRNPFFKKVAFASAEMNTTESFMYSFSDNGDQRDKDEFVGQSIMNAAHYQMKNLGNLGIRFSQHLTVDNPQKMSLLHNPVINEGLRQSLYPFSDRDCIPSIPYLFSHTKGDRRVPYCVSAHAYNALKRAGHNDAYLQLIPGGTHSSIMGEESFLRTLKSFLSDSRKKSLNELQPDMYLIPEEDDWVKRFEDIRQDNFREILTDYTQEAYRQYAPYQKQYHTLSDFRKTCVESLKRNYEELEKLKDKYNPIIKDVSKDEGILNPKKDKKEEVNEPLKTIPPHIASSDDSRAKETCILPKVVDRGDINISSMQDKKAIYAKRAFVIIATGVLVIVGTGVAYIKGFFNFCKEKLKNKKINNQDDQKEKRSYLKQTNDGVEDVFKKQLNENVMIV